MPHPDDDRVTLSSAELEAAYRQHWDKYMKGFRKIAAEHADDLNAVKNPTDEERAECEQD